MPNLALSCAVPTRDTSRLAKSEDNAFDLDSSYFLTLSCTQGVSLDMSAAVKQLSQISSNSLFQMSVADAEASAFVASSLSSCLFSSLLSEGSGVVSIATAAVGVSASAEAVAFLSNVCVKVD